MIDFTDKTYANLLDGQLQRVPETVDKRETSLIQTALGPVSWTLEGFYLILAQLQQNASTVTAVGDALDLKVAERGIARSSATPSTYEGVFNVEIPDGSRFSTITGANSLVLYSSTPMPLTDGFFHYEMVCETPGQAGNGQIGSLLPITFIPNLTSAQLVTLILPGTDKQDDDSLRQEFTDSLRDLPFGGNIASYRSFILAQSNVGAVQVYPHWQGGGTVMCSILDGNYDTATQGLIEVIQNLVCPTENSQTDPSNLGFGIAPIGHLVTISTASRFKLTSTQQFSLKQEYRLKL